jgi:hypothetical protein
LVDAVVMAYWPVEHDELGVMAINHVRLDARKVAIDEPNNPARIKGELNPAVCSRGGASEPDLAPLVQKASARDPEELLPLW